MKPSFTCARATEFRLFGWLRLIRTVPTPASRRSVGVAGRILKTCLGLALGVFGLTTPLLHAQANYATPYTFTTYAGVPGSYGFRDTAVFDNPSGVVCDRLGNIYVADSTNGTIRKIAPDGAVTTFAGAPGMFGTVDGTGWAAQFSSPFGVAIDAAGNLYVSEVVGAVIRKITPAGVVTTLAGSPGNAGSADGRGSAAQFYTPRGLAVDAAGNVYVADTGNHTIRKVTAAGVVTTLAGTAGMNGFVDGTGAAARFDTPSSLTVDNAGTIYVADTGNGTIRKITSAGVVTTLAGTPHSYDAQDGTGTAAHFQYPHGIVVDGSGNLYVGDTANELIRKVTPDGVVTTVAGMPMHPGTSDGPGSSAQFYYPMGVALGGSGQLYVADYFNHTVRMVALSGVVTTVAGVPGTPGTNDGSGTSGLFNMPAGVVVDAAGNVLVADNGNGAIREISPSGIVTTPVTWVGGLEGPFGLAIDGSGNFYASASNVIWKITPDFIMTPLAGMSGNIGSADGKGEAASFDAASGLAVDSAGNVYVADRFNHTIRKITPDGVVTTLAGKAGVPGSDDGVGSAARFRYPFGVAVDTSGTVFVADSGNNVIRKIAADGKVTTIAGTVGIWNATDGTGAAAHFNAPRGIVVDASGNLFITDSDDNHIRMMTPAGVVTTLAGSLSTLPGKTDGTGSDASFSDPMGIAVDPAGRLFVTDFNNDTVRLGVLAPPVTIPVVVTVDSLNTVYTGQPQPVSVSTDPAGLAVSVTYDGSALPPTDAGTYTVVATVTEPGYSGTATGTLVIAKAPQQINFTQVPDKVPTDAPFVVEGSVDSGLPLTLSLFEGPGTMSGNTITLTGDIGIIFVLGSQIGDVNHEPTSQYLPIVVALPRVVVETPYTFTTLAGSPTKSGGADGTGAAAQFTGPFGMAVDSAGNVYVSDQNRSTIRKITPAGVVTTVAGLDNVLGSADGVGTAARFTYPRGLALDPAGNIYVADTRNQTIRKITPAGVVTTLAGLAGVSGFNDGIGSAARFYDPSGVALDQAGNIYVADTDNFAIRKITPAGVVTTVSPQLGGSEGPFDYPSAIAVDDAGNVYFAEELRYTIRKITPAGVVTTIAGIPGKPGSTDGGLGVAQFGNDYGLAVDGLGFVYVADTTSHIIRRIAPDGSVTTVGGTAFAPGSADGVGSAARFWYPYGLARDRAGALYVADNYNHTIRKGVPASAQTATVTLGNLSAVYTGSAQPVTVVTFPAGLAVNVTYNGGSTPPTDAGSYAVTATVADPAYSGSANGTLIIAKADQAISFDAIPNKTYGDSPFTIYAAANSGASPTLSIVSGPATIAGNTITLTGVGTVLVRTTLAGDANHNAAASVDRSFVVGKGTAVIILGGTGTIYDSLPHAAVVNTVPTGLAVSIAYDGSVTPPTNVGTYTVTATVNDPLYQGTISVPFVIAPPAPTADATPYTFTTYAGASDAGSVDGVRSAARFNQPNGVAVDVVGNVYVADTNNNVVRKITPAGVVSTLAGTPGTQGPDDGLGAAARFNAPTGIALDGSGNVYVADAGNGTIRRITPAGLVATVAGQANQIGSADGAGSAARFNHPEGLAVDDAGNIYVADTGNQLVRKVTAAGVVTTLAGSAGTAALRDGTGSTAWFNAPSGISLDHAGNLLIADRINGVLRKVTPAGVVTTIAAVSGSSGDLNVFMLPSGVTYDATGNAFVTSSGGPTIERMTSAAVVTTIAGQRSFFGFQDGTGPVARFGSPMGIAVSLAGEVYVADSFNNAIRKGVLATRTPATVTLGNLATVYTGAPQQATATTVPAGLAVTLSYNGSFAVPLQAGAYLVVANIQDTAYSGTATGTMVIAKANQTLTFDSIADHSYGDAPFTVNVSADSGLVPTLSVVSGPVTLNGQTVTFTGVGPVVLRASQAGDINHNAATSVDRTFTIHPGTAGIILGGLNATYDGAFHAATAVTNPPGLVVDLTYDGGTTAPTNPGTYAVNATIHDANYVGSATGQLVIAKIPATVTLSGLGWSYDGQPKAVTTATIPSGLAVDVTYNGLSTPPTNPGTYLVVATINDPLRAGTASGSLVITITALVRHAPTINAGLDGSLQVLTPEAMSFGSSAWISGDLLVPGTPAVQLSGTPVYGGTVDGVGDASPSTYTITLDGTVLRHIVRRADPIALAAVNPPPLPAGTRSVTLTTATQSAGDFTTLRNLTLTGNAGTVAVPPGTYGNLNASGNSTLVLGVAGATTPVIYNLQSLSINTLPGKAQLQVVGPVVVLLANGALINGDAGSAANPGWLQLQFAAGGLTLSGSFTFHGSVVAPAGALTLNVNTTFDGSVVADRLIINGTSVLK